MNVARAVWRELTGMFVDDEYLALAILAVVGAAAALASWLGPQSPIVGATLMFGCIGVLRANVMRAVNKR